MSGPAPLVDSRPALSGHLRLRAAPDGCGRTHLREQSFRAPFHVGKSYWDGVALQVQVVNPTAGILEGDRLDLDVTVDAGAALLVTTPAAARAFVMRNGRAECVQRFAVRSCGWLEYVPEPLFPHREADYRQTTTVDVDASGEAAFLDAFAPGRVGRGERWAWRRLLLSLEIRYAGEPVLRECLDSDGAALARAADYFRTPDAFFATMVLITERLPGGDPVWTEVRRMHETGTWVGASALRRGGWVIRIVAPNGQALRDVLARLRALFAAALPGLGSDLRKL